MRIQMPDGKKCDAVDTSAFHRSSKLTFMSSVKPLLTDTDDTLLHRIRGEFVEMPGLRLTKEQAARLWHLDPNHVTSLLRVLVDAQFLARSANGAYRRAGGP